MRGMLVQGQTLLFRGRKQGVLPLGCIWHFPILARVSAGLLLFLKKNKITLMNYHIHKFVIHRYFEMQDDQHMLLSQCQLICS